MCVHVHMCVNGRCGGDARDDGNTLRPLFDDGVDDIGVELACDVPAYDVEAAVVDVVGEAATSISSVFTSSLHDAIHPERHATIIWYIDLKSVYVATRQALHMYVCTRRVDVSDCAYIHVCMHASGCDSRPVVQPSVCVVFAVRTVCASYRVTCEPARVTVTHTRDGHNWLTIVDVVQLTGGIPSLADRRRHSIEGARWPLAYHRVSGGVHECGRNVYVSVGRDRPSWTDR
jgi:hypothetical protein